jgi:hypothetical protein
VKETAVVMVTVGMECAIAKLASLVSSVTHLVAKRTAICEACVSQKNASVKVTSMEMPVNTADVSMTALVMVTAIRVRVLVHRDGKE